MGTIEELRPNANRVGTGAFTPGGGAGSVHGALSDNDDATWVTRTASGDKTAYLDLDSYTLPADHKVKRIRAAARVRFDTKPLLFAWGGLQTGEAPFVEKVRQAKNSGIDTFYTAWVNASEAAAGPNPPIMTQANINTLFMYIRDKSSSAVNRFYDVWLELDIIERPTVAVSAPTGSIALSRPAVEWSYSDGDGDIQAQYEVRIFTAAQYGAGGFDPETSTATWESGQIVAADDTVTVGEPLANGSYRAYVRVAKDGGNEAYWSDWDYEAFTVALTQPATPSLSVVQDYADTEVEVTVSGSTITAGLTDGTVRVQRSVDEATWEDVRLSYLQPSMSGSWTVTITDYEAPRDVEVFYRAQVIGYDTVNTSWSPSAWSTTDSLIPELDDSWFAAVWVPGDLVETDGYSYRDGEWVVYAPTVADDPITEQVEPGTESILRPLGRRGAVVVSEDLSLGDGSLEFLARDDQFDALAALTAAQEPILLRQPGVTQKWVTWVGARAWSIEPGIRSVAVSYVGIDTPAVT